MILKPYTKRRIIYFLEFETLGMFDDANGLTSFSGSLKIISKEFV